MSPNWALDISRSFWVALDADSKLIVSWLVGSRDEQSARTFLYDLSTRLRSRVQITSDGLRAYVDAVEHVFGSDVDFAQIVKNYGTPDDTGKQMHRGRYKGSARTPIAGHPDDSFISTSFVERQNLNLRMGMRRYTRRTNAFSKRLENHVHHVALWTVWHNWCRRHMTLRTTPAQAAGLAESWHDAEWIVGLVNAAAPTRKKPGPNTGWRTFPKAAT